MDAAALKKKKEQMHADQTFCSYNSSLCQNDITKNVTQSYR